MVANKTGLVNYLIVGGKSQDKSWSELSNMFNFPSGEAARSFWKWYKVKNKNLIDKKEELVSTLEEYESKINNEKGEGTVKWISTKEVLTTEDIYKECRMDPNIWVMTQIWHKKRGTGFVYSADFKLKKKDNPDILAQVLSNYTTSYKPISKSDFIQNDKYSSPSCLLLSLPDLHLDKACINKTTAKEAVENYERVLMHLLHKSYSSHFIEEIVFVLGNDFYHTDSIHNTTTKGTPLFVNTDWNLAYEMGFDLMVKCIGKLKQFCNKLHIVLIPGNHSITKEYYLAHALEVYFKSDKSIVFDREKDDLKTHKYGETLMCFSHGNNINDKLPLVFATTFYQEWGECKYKEIILGDKHHNTEKIISSQGEANGVRMRILPSLSGTDQWHQDNLYVNAIQSGIALIYDFEKGKVSEFESRI